MKKITSKSWLNAMGIAMGSLSIGLGVLGIYGWHSGSLPLIQIQPDLIPIPYNAAIAFTIYGAALIALFNGSKKIPRYVGVFTVLFGVTVLLQFFLKFDFGVDRPLVVPSQIPELALSSKIPLGGGISFCLAGLALFLMTFYQRFKHPFLVVAGLGALLLARSIMAFFHYLMGVQMPMLWSHSMAIPGAIQFSFIGIAIFAFIYKEKPPLAYSVHWVPVTVVIGALSITFSFWQAQVAKDKARIAQLVYLNGLNISHDVKLNMDARIQALNHMARTWKWRGRPSSAQWHVESRAILNDYAGFQYVGWVDSSHYLQLVEPPQTVRPLLTRKIIFELLGETPEREPSPNKIILAGPGKFFSTVPEFVACVPIPGGAFFEGMIIGSFDQKRLFSAIVHQPVNDDFSVRIDFDDKNFYEVNTPPRGSGILWTAPIAVTFYGITWNLRVAPTPVFLKKNRSYLAETMLIAGILLSLLFGLIIYFLQSIRNRARVLQVTNMRLEKEVDLRKSTELSYAEQTARLQSILDAMGDGVMVADKDGRIIRINPAARKIMRINVSGLSPDQWELPMDVFKSDGVTPFIPKEYPIVRATRGEMVDAEEMLLRFSPTDHVWISATTRPILAENGDVQGAVSIFRDITEVKRADDMLRRSREELTKLAFIVQSSEDAIIGTTLEGVITSWNDGAEKIFGYKDDEIKGHSLAKLFPDKNAEEHLSHFETVHLHKDGRSIPVSVTTSPIKSEKGEIVGSSFVARDISERRKAEEIIRVAHAELEHRVLERTKELDVAVKNRDAEITARKRIEKELAKRAEELAMSNQELEQFALVASHDLQEPLRKISSYGELLSQRYKGQLDEKADKFIGYMIDGVHRMQNLIKGLLAYSRVGKAEFQFRDIDLKEIVQQTINDLESSIQENNAQVTFDNLPAVSANPAQMGQLMQNLISNGLKFRSQDPPRIHIGGEQKDNEWVIAVKDNGIGIEEQHLDRIFQIFQRLHNQKDFPGTGIGLAICKKILERHGGRIWVQSTKGKGTTFYFSLPVKTEAKAPAASVS